MIRKPQRFAFLAIGGLGLLAAIAPGLAAGLNIAPASSGTPAAGQGAIDVQGFEVENINWTLTDGGQVTQVTFNIFREADDRTASSVLAANATVRVLLNDGDGAGSNTTWNACTLPASGTTGAAVCDTTADGVDVSANDLEKVEVIAFDSN